MLGLGFPEIARRHDLGDDFAGPQPGLVDVGNRVLGNAPLFLGRVEDRRSIAGADVVPWRLRVVGS